MKGLNLPKIKKYEVPGGIFKRMIAFLIDLFIINLVIVTPFRSRLISKIPDDTFTNTFEFLNSNPNIVNEIYGILMMIIFLMYLYFVIFDIKMGQTPGKMFMKLFVLSDTKKPLTIMQSAVRNFGVVLFILFFPLIFADILFAFFNKEKRRLLENFSQTKTIERLELQ